MVILPVVDLDMEVENISLLEIVSNENGQVLVRTVDHLHRHLEQRLIHPIHLITMDHQRKTYLPYLSFRCLFFFLSLFLLAL